MNSGHEDLLEDIDAGLDRIESLLDEQDEELTRLDSEMAEWVKPPLLSSKPVQAST